MLVSGILPNYLDDYVTLWGVGSLLGKTKDVDMRHGVLRILVSCTDYRSIAHEKDVLIKGCGYVLAFRVEAPAGLIDPADTDMLDTHDDSDGGERPSRMIPTLINLIPKAKL